LQYIFRKPYFFEGQFEAITRIFQSKDTLLLLPTGAGKSLVYQLSSLLLPGITMVIDPIISLMEDQMDNLSIMGIDSCIAISSNIRDSSIRTEIIKIMGDGEYYFVFLSPERFQTVQFRQSLRTLTVGTPVSLIVIDEAHCVSEWGHDFRTAYLNIGRNSREFCKYENFIPPVIGLTGTASRSVLKDIQRELQIEDFDAIITPKTFDRKELKFHVIPCTSKEKIPKLKGILSQKLPNLFNTSTSTFFEPLDKNTYSGLIFCQHVGGNYGIINVSNYIKNELYIPVDIYSGKNPKYSDEDRWKDHKTTVTKNFKRNKIPLLVCTKAFGMGIDKPNIRYTIHFGIPASIESFYQESGRAGRDKKTAHCFIIVSNDDKKRSEKLLNPNTTVEEICETEKNLTIEEHDDITRVLYFHTNSFIGIQNEKKEIRQVLMQIGDASKKQEKTINFSSIYRNGIDEEQNVNPRLTKEKAVHRLLTIGVISDYTIDYSRNIFSLQLTGATKQQIITSYGNYIGSYLLSRKEVEVEKASQFLNLEYIDFVLKIVELLLNFIYDVIEKGRRRAIQEMLLACEGRSFFNNAVDDSIDKFIRSRILRYLEATQYSEILEKILEAQDAGLIRSKEIMDNVLSSNDAAELRGQVTRYLESYPDHPALLMLRSLSEIYCRDKNNEIVKQNFLASISSSKTQYGLKDYIVYEYASWGISKIYYRDIICASALINELIKDSDRFHIRLFISKLEPEFAGIPAWLLLKKLADSCAFLLFKKGE
jgi:RecQ family ATP-dependent DNA helicase